MLIITNDLQSWNNKVIEDYKLEHLTTGEFHVLFHRNLTKIKGKADNLDILYGVKYQHEGQPQGNYITALISGSEVKIEGDSAGLCPFNLVPSKSGFHLFNDIRLAKYFTDKNSLQLSQKEMIAYLNTGFTNPQNSLFENSIFSSPDKVYSLSGNEIKISSKAKAQPYETFKAFEFACAEFSKVLKLSISNVISQLKPSDCLISGGSDTRIMLLHMEKNTLSKLNFINLYGWNPNAQYDWESAKILGETLDIDIQRKDSSKNLDPMYPSLWNFLSLKPLEELTLSGFHGTEFIGDGSYEFLKVSDSENQPELQNVLSSLTTTFLGSIYEGIQGPLFHFPFLLQSQGFLSPFRDSLLLSFLNSLPKEFTKDYRIYREIFQHSNDSISKVPFFSKITDYDQSLPSINKTSQSLPQLHKSQFNIDTSTTEKLLGRIKKLEGMKRMRMINLEILNRYINNELN